MKIEMDGKILDRNNKMGRKHMAIRNALILKNNKFWKRYGKLNKQSGHVEIKNPKLINTALKLQKEIDDENLKVLKCLTKGRILWQGLV